MEKFKNKLEQLATEYDTTLQRMQVLREEFNSLNTRKCELEGAIKLLNEMMIEDSCNVVFTEKSEELDDT